MITLKSNYSFEDFETAFPRGELITNTIGNTVPRYNRFWDYNNKVLMCIPVIHPRDEEKDIETYTSYVWVMFMKRPELGLYWTLYSASSSEEVIKVTDHNFNPPVPVAKYNSVDVALDMIEVNIQAVLKETDYETNKAILIQLLGSKRAKSDPKRMEEIQDSLDNLKQIPIKDVLKKSACSYIYYSNNSWHAFYPSTTMLISFHKRANTEINQKYLDFLSSQEFKDIRAAWDEVNTITPGE
jgi:hypothetical protein